MVNVSYWEVAAILSGSNGYSTTLIWYFSWAGESCWRYLLSDFSFRRWLGIFHTVFHLLNSWPLMSTQWSNVSLPVSVERVVLRGVTHKAEESTEVAYEVSTVTFHLCLLFFLLLMFFSSCVSLQACWSHGFVSSVVRTIKEVKELLTQVSSNPLALD